MMCIRMDMTHVYVTTHACVHVRSALSGELSEFCIVDIAFVFQEIIPTVRTLEVELRLRIVAAIWSGLAMVESTAPGNSDGERCAALTLTHLLVEVP